MKKGILCACAAVALMIAGCGEKKPADVPVTKVEINKATLSLEVDAEETLTAEVTPKNATSKAVTWSPKDAAIATVDAKTGKVKAVKVGDTEIYAKAGGKSATCKVTVTAKAVPANDVKLSNETATVEEGKTFNLSTLVTYLPEGATTGKEATYAIAEADRAMATVDAAGVVTGVKATPEGTTVDVTIALKSNPEKKQVCKLTVTAPAGR